MPKVFINTLPHQIVTPTEIWEDLLTQLDESAAQQGLMLTAARFDGVEEPSFRDPAVRHRPLNGIGRIDVETATPSAFLRQCLLECIPALERSAELTQRLCGLYRDQDLSGRHEGLTTLARDLRELALLIGMLGGPLGIDLAAVESSGISAAGQLDALVAIIDALAAAQQSEDWLTVADTLEWDLEPAIRNWIALLMSLADRLKQQHLPSTHFRS